MRYVIQGHYLPTGETEEIDSTNDHAEAVSLVTEYKLAYGNQWIVAMEAVND